MVSNGEHYIINVEHGHKNHKMNGANGNMRLDGMMIEIPCDMRNELLLHFAMTVVLGLIFRKLYIYHIYMRGFPTNLLHTFNDWIYKLTKVDGISD